MNKAYLLIGGNVGNRQENLHSANHLLQTSCGEIGLRSHLYETAAWGKTDQPPFLNQALLLLTGLTAQMLLQKILAAESQMGRERAEKYGPRVIDIDILFFNDDIIQKPGLVIPHPEIRNRRFALTPLCEIAPGLVHPVFLKTIEQLLEECPDELEVKKFSTNN